LKYLTRPGLDIRKAFGYVRDDVMSATGNQQEPYTTNSLGGDDVALVPAAAPPPAPAPAASNADVRRDYEAAERVGTREAWDYFIAAHPSGFYAELAKAQRNKLTEAQRNGPPNNSSVASAEPAKSDEARSGAKSDGPAVAAIPPAPAAEPSRPTEAAPPDIARLLQTELRRVGCKSGEVEDEWDASARKALSLFNDKAGTQFDVKVASLDALDAVRAKTGRVCPLECGHGQHASGDHCVKITCGDDEVLTSSGCRPRPQHTPKAAPRRHAGGKRCFVYSGSSFCE
jgi:hypothetical protein